jgi:hypothetical protein
MELPGSVPSPMTEEDKMEAFREAKRLVQRRTMIWGVAIAFILLTAFGMLVLVYMGLTSVGP